MKRPLPKSGTVIRYGFLWPVESLEGYTEPRKYRTCLVLGSEKLSDGTYKVLVAPITHLEPPNKTGSLELSKEERRQSGLDHKRQWIRLDQVNHFTWPGQYVQNIKGKNTHIYGNVSKRVFEATIKKMLVLKKKDRIRTLDRDGKAPAFA